jgi:DNA polymerase-3 subunit delta
VGTACKSTPLPTLQFYSNGKRVSARDDVVAVKAGDVENFLARADRAPPIILVYGPDAGLVHERAEALIRNWVDNPSDPFLLVRLEGDELEPTRLVEEANTIPLFGGRRAVWVKGGGRNIVAAVDALIACPSADCRVVIEAGELRSNAPLRVACEQAKNAVALPCYPDNEQQLHRLIEQEMHSNGMSISREASTALVSLLGGDRLASRQELAKLALFARGKGEVGLKDIIAVVSDASALEADDLVDAAFSGHSGDLELKLGRARTAGIAPGTVVFAAVRHAAQLHKARIAIERGASTWEAGKGVFGYFNRKDAINTALQIWTSARLERAMTQLAEAALESRRQSALASVIEQRALLALAANAGEKTGARRRS